MKSFYIHKLGCPKNDVDADYLSGYLIKLNLEPVSNPGSADLLIINTCGFILPAKEESVESILELGQLKKNGQKLIVTGCLSQRYAHEMDRQMPEVDAVFGICSLTEIKDFIQNAGRRAISPSKIPSIYAEYNHRRIINPDESFAYLKIADGCSNRCSYCAIPSIRGDYRSRRIEAIVDEARFLLDRGKKELILVSQEATAYGNDLYGKGRLIELLDEISALEGDFWLRVMYMHPARTGKELIDYIIDNPKICSYFDIPLQHVNDRIMALMNRSIEKKRIEELLDYIKGRDEKAAIRTTFIVGFPGETEAEFSELYDFVEKRRFERMGTFVYSPEEGTPAEKLPAQVKEDVSNRRYDDLMQLQQEIAFEHNRQSVGQATEVLIDSLDDEDGYPVGRTRFDAPEIDQIVRIESNDAVPGEIITAVITGYQGYDLAARRGVS